jgi:ankyrin repeat protein
MGAVKFLLENGADVNTKDNKDFTLLMYCVQYNDLSLIKLALSYGARVKDIDKSGFTALDYAIQNNNLDAIKLLFDNGSDISDESYMLALEYKYKTIIKFFDCLDPNKQIFQKKGYCKC